MSMRGLKLVVAGLLVTTFAFANNNDAYGQTVAKSNKTEIKANSRDVTAKDTEGSVRIGTSSEARDYSLDNGDVLVLHIAGGKNEKYTAEQYGNMLVRMFKDTKRTKYPTDIIVFYDKEVQYNYAGVRSLSGAESYDENGGRKWKQAIPSSVRLIL